MAGLNLQSSNTKGLAKLSFGMTRRAFLMEASKARSPSVSGALTSDELVG